MRITIDAHNDTLMKVIDPDTWTFSTNIGYSTSFQLDLSKMVEGELDVACFAAYTDDLGHPNRSNGYLLAMMHALDQTADMNRDRMAKVMSVEGLREALSTGKRCAIQTIEGGYGFDEANAEVLLRQFFDAGVRMLAPVWNYSNLLGEGTLKQYKDGVASSGGLTVLGKKFVGWMEALGMIVDVSHMDEATFWSTVDVAKKPLVASHSGAYAVRPHVRNLKDDQLRAVAGSGGVVCVVFCRGFIGDDTAGVEALLDHIEHVIKVAGVDSVGLGSDFDGARMPVDLPDASHVQLIADGLLTRGYSEDVVDKVMGGNMLRVLEGAMPAEDASVERHEVVFDGERVSVRVPDADFSWPVKGWINGLERECRFDAESKVVYMEVDSGAFYRIFIATVEYVKENGCVERVTGIVWADE